MIKPLETIQTDQLSFLSYAYLSSIVFFANPLSDKLWMRHNHRILGVLTYWLIILRYRIIWTLRLPSFKFPALRPPSFFLNTFLSYTSNRFFTSVYVIVGLTTTLYRAILALRVTCKIDPSTPLGRDFNHCWSL